MNAIQKILVGAAVISVPLFGACKKDPVSCNWATEVQAELDAVTAATTAYTNDPSPANCNAFKDAYEDYLNELEDHVECATVAGQQAQLQQSIDAAQASLDAIQC